MEKLFKIYNGVMMSNLNSRFYLKSIKKFLFDHNIIILCIKFVINIFDFYSVINKKSKVVNNALKSSQDKLLTTQFIIKNNSYSKGEELNLFQ